MYQLIANSSYKSQSEWSKTNVRISLYCPLRPVVPVMPTGSAAVSCLCAVISRYPCELRDSGAYKAGSMGYISVPLQWNALVRSSTWWHHDMGMFSAWLPLCWAPVVYPDKSRDSITELICFHSLNVLMMWQSSCRWCDVFCSPCNKKSTLWANVRIELPGGRFNITSNFWSQKTRRDVVGVQILSLLTRDLPISKHTTSRVWDFARSNIDTFYRILKRGPGCIWSVALLYYVPWNMYLVLLSFALVWCYYQLPVDS